MDSKIICEPPCGSMRRALRIIWRSSEMLEFVPHFIAIDARILIRNCAKQLSQLGYIPLAIAEFVDHAPVRFCLGDLKCFVKRGIGQSDSQAFIQDQDRLPRVFDQGASANVRV